MDGTSGYGAAVDNLRKVSQSQQCRASTVRTAVGAVLAWIGAQRVRDCLDGDPERAGDRRLIAACAELEALADMLDETPNPGGRRAPDAARARAETWQAVVAQTSRVRRALEQERASATRSA